ncbi:MAG: endonuclease domain-containing protein [Chloroflexi bacterium]|nr:endonuclease domain-containing protein [Chloroflexota bacterium]
MEPIRVVRGQPVSKEKLTAAKALRRQMTRSEALLWESLRRNQLGGLHFRRQQVIAGFIVDFYCHAARLVVEVDGSAHDTQGEYDADRDRVLAGLGLSVLRVRADDVLTDLNGVLARIAAHNIARHPPSSPEARGPGR